VPSSSPTGQPGDVEDLADDLPGRACRAPLDVEDQAPKVVEHQAPSHPEPCPLATPRPPPM